MDDIRNQQDFSQAIHQLTQNMTQCIKYLNTELKNCHALLRQERYEDAYDLAEQIRAGVMLIEECTQLHTLHAFSEIKSMSTSIKEKSMECLENGTT